MARANRLLTVCHNLRQSPLNRLRAIRSHAHHFDRNLHFVFDHSDVVVEACRQAFHRRHTGQIFLPTLVVGIGRRDFVGLDAKRQVRRRGTCVFIQVAHGNRIKSVSTSAFIMAS